MMLTRRAALGVLGSLAACRRPSVAGQDRPLVLVFGPAYAPRSRDALAQRLAGQLPVDVRIAHSNKDAIDLVQSGQADAALLPLLDYLFCADVYGVAPLVQVVRRGSERTYAGELVVAADATFGAVSALAGKRVAYADPFSVTGFLLQAALLRKAGVTIEPHWLGSHEAVVAAVRDGKVDAGATYAGHAAATPGLRVLAVTGSVPNEPVLVQSAVPAAVRDRLALALFAATPTELEGLAGATGFAAPAAGAYELARATVTAAGQAVEDTVPGGWSRANEQRRPSWSYGI